MKIGELDNTLVVQKPQETGKGRAPADPGQFQSILDDQLRAADHGKEMSAPVEPLSSLMRASLGLYGAPIDGLSVAGQLAGMDAAVNDSMTVLDEGLENVERLSGSGSMKDIGQAIEKLQKEADDFAEGVRGLPSDHPLKRAGEELNVLAYVESVKWKRGDYL